MFINIYDYSIFMARISDISIIKELLKNSRNTNTGIAKKLKVSEATVRKRIKNMEENKTIRGYNVDVNPKRIGYEIDALIGLDTEPEAYIHVEKMLRKNKDIIKLWRSTGDHMFLFECWFKDRKDMETFIFKLEKTKGVTKVCPAILLERIK